MPPEVQPAIPARPVPRSAAPRAWYADGVDRRWLFLALTVLALLLSSVLTVIGQPLVTPAAPRGIVSFELARALEPAVAMLASWDEGARQRALLSLGLDYLYLFVYPAWLALSMRMLGRSLSGAFERTGRRLSWIVLAAVPLGALENVALIREIVVAPSLGLARLAWACAVPKFLLVGAAFAYLLVAVSVILARRLRAA